MGHVTRRLIWCNVALFIAQLGYGDWIIAHLALWPLGRFGFQPWQLVTSAFVHANLAHLGLNMFALWSFGRDVEEDLGRGRFLRLYGASVLASALTQLLVASLDASSSGTPIPTVGASGGIFGVLLAFGMLFPRRTVVLLFPPIPMPAWFLVLAYAVIELGNGVLGTSAGVAHFAHLGGMVGAYLVLRLDRPDRDRRLAEIS